MSSIHQNSFTATALLLPVLLVGSYAQAMDPAVKKDISGIDSHTVFTAPPAPEEIAGILFPPTYRSAANGTSDSKPAPLFSMMINFGFDSATILPESEPMLQSLGEMMGIESVAKKSIVVEGHTDAIGNQAYNQKLSEKRARAIKDYLVEHYGIAPKRLVTVGKGERQLYTESKPGAPINRRATFRPAKKVVLR